MLTRAEKPRKHLVLKTYVLFKAERREEFARNWQLFTNAVDIHLTLVYSKYTGPLPKNRFSDGPETSNF